MKHPFWYLGGVAVGLLMRGWRATIRCEVRNRLAREGPCVIAAWHGRLVGVLMENFGSGLVTMASRSSDGAFAAGAVRMVGLRVARGSSSRGGREALADMNAALGGGAPRAGLTVDGPKGPWRRVKPGVVALALKHEIPVVPATFSCRRPWILGSWDRMVLPRPFTRMVVTYGEPWTADRLRAAPDSGLEVIGAELDRMSAQLDAELTGAPLWPDRTELPPLP